MAQAPPAGDGAGAGAGADANPGPANLAGFARLPPELRDMIWRRALPEPRVFTVLVYLSSGLKTVLLARPGSGTGGGGGLPVLAAICSESRRALADAGYALAFADPERHGAADPGVWFSPDRDVVERTMWAPGDFWGPSAAAADAAAAEVGSDESRGERAGVERMAPTSSDSLRQQHEP